MSETKTIYGALVLAQAEMTKAKKDSENPHYRSKYADLSSVADACLPALNRHGIAVTQPIVRTEHGLAVKTIFTHADSGESVSTEVPLMVPQAITMQQLGSAITYGRRYGLMALSNIAPDDDDGNGASAAGPADVPKKTKPISKSERAKLALSIFGDLDIFEDWVYRSKGVAFADLEETTKAGLFQFLKGHTDPAKWSPKLQQALADAKAEAIEAQEAAQ